MLPHVVAEGLILGISGVDMQGATCLLQRGVRQFSTSCWHNLFLLLGEVTVFHLFYKAQLFLQLFHIVLRIPLFHCYHDNLRKTGPGNCQHNIDLHQTTQLFLHSAYCLSSSRFLNDRFYSFYLVMLGIITSFAWDSDWFRNLWMNIISMITFSTSVYKSSLFKFLNNLSEFGRHWSSHFYPYSYNYQHTIVWDGGCQAKRGEIMVKTRGKKTEKKWPER